MELKEAATLRFRTATDLVEAIEPVTGIYDITYCFRGQGSSEYNLMPSAWRDYKKGKDGYQFVANDPGRSLVIYEVTQLLFFVQLANSQGLDIPGGFDDAKRILEGFESCKNTFDLQEWPPLNILPLLALAQHYGFPTRLLDWTKSAYTAAYFAAEDSVLNTQECQEIAVWACQLARNGQSDSRLFNYEPPYCGNENARFQQGLLMCLRSDKLHDPISLDKLHDIEEPNARIALFQKLVLPTSESEHLMYLVSHFGISASHLFPGYASLARTAKLQRFGIKNDMTRMLEESGRIQLAAEKRRAKFEEMLRSGKIVAKEE